MVQGLHLRSCNAGSPGSIPGQRTRSLHVIAKAWHSHIKINSYFLKEEKGRKVWRKGKKSHPEIKLIKDDSLSWHAGHWDKDSSLQGPTQMLEGVWHP